MTSSQDLQQYIHRAALGSTVTAGTEAPHRPHTAAACRGTQEVTPASWIPLT
jgi:hypothetical protein